MKNEKEDLQQIVSGATKDITDVTKLLLSLARYRAETMGPITQAVNNLRNQQVQQDAAPGASQEGYLGARPANITSVAELMLVDSDTNVYEDQNIQFQETVEFNFRGKKQKVLSKKEKAKLDAKMRLKIRKDQIQKDEARKRKEIGAAPKSITANTGVSGGMRNQQNEYDYVATEHQIDDIGLESGTDSEDSGGDFEQYDKRRKEHKKQRQDELGVQLADAAEASMMTPNQSILQQSPAAEPMEDDGELATEVNSDG